MQVGWPLGFPDAGYIFHAGQLNATLARIARLLSALIAAALTRVPVTPDWLGA